MKQSIKELITTWIFSHKESNPDSASNDLGQVNGVPGTLNHSSVN